MGKMQLAEVESQSHPSPHSLPAPSAPLLSPHRPYRRHTVLHLIRKPRRIAPRKSP